MKVSRIFLLLTLLINLIAFKTANTMTDIKFQLPSGNSLKTNKSKEDVENYLNSIHDDALDDKNKDLMNAISTAVITYPDLEITKTLISKLFDKFNYHINSINNISYPILQFFASISKMYKTLTPQIKEKFTTAVNLFINNKNLVEQVEHILPQSLDKFSADELKYEQEMEKYMNTTFVEMKNRYDMYVFYAIILTWIVKNMDDQATHKIGLNFAKNGVTHENKIIKWNAWMLARYSNKTESSTEFEIRSAILIEFCESELNDTLKNEVIQFLKKVYHSFSIKLQDFNNLPQELKEIIIPFFTKIIDLGKSSEIEELKQKATEFEEACKANNITIESTIKEKHEDYYKILGLTKTAKETEIKKAYRKLSNIFHPDKLKAGSQPEQEAATKISQILNHARTMLLSDSKSYANPTQDQTYQKFCDLKKTLANYLMKIDLQKLAQSLNNIKLPLDKLNQKLSTLRMSINS